jgi:hypothetical protein
MQVQKMRCKSEKHKIVPKTFIKDLKIQNIYEMKSSSSPFARAPFLLIQTL